MIGADVLVIAGKQPTHPPTYLPSPSPQHLIQTASFSSIHPPTHLPTQKAPSSSPELPLHQHHAHSAPPPFPHISPPTNKVQHLLQTASISSVYPPTHPPRSPVTSTLLSLNTTWRVGAFILLYLPTHPPNPNTQHLVRTASTPHPPIYLPTRKRQRFLHRSYLYKHNALLQLR